jgi:hypothetical protein
MNTAVGRRLTLEDRVVWIGKDGYQAAGLGTITRITVHEIEVRWDGGSVTRYRRVHLHNLRHAKFISETVESDHKAHYGTFADDRTRQDHDTGGWSTSPKSADASSVIMRAAAKKWRLVPVSGSCDSALREGTKVG